MACKWCIERGLIPENEIKKIIEKLEKSNFKIKK